MGREAVAAGIQKMQPSLLQFAVALRAEMSKVIAARGGHWRIDDPRLPHLKQQVADQFAIENAVLSLVIVAHQTVVAGCLAIFAGVWRALQVGAARIEMADPERLFGDLGDGPRLVD